MKYNGKMVGWRDRWRGRKEPARTGIDHNEEVKLLNHKGFNHSCSVASAGCVFEQFHGEARTHTQKNTMVTVLHNGS